MSGKLTPSIMYLTCEHRDDQMDVDDAPKDPGLSREQFMDVDEEGDEDVEEEENDDSTQLLRIPPVMGTTRSQPTSRSASVARSTASSTPSQVNPFLLYPAEDRPKTIKLLYVPDPTRAKDRLDVTHSLSWVKRHLRPDQLTSIKHLKGFYAKARSGKDDLDGGGLPYRLFEWVSDLP